MEIRIFLLKRKTIPEWGCTEHLDDKYFCISDLNNLFSYLEEEYSFYFSTENKVYKKYYPIDRSELVAELIEIIPEKILC